MSIYSVPLGGGSIPVGFTHFYTVPAGQGPAVIRDASVVVSPGGFGAVVVTRGGVTSRLVQLDNSGGAIWVGINPVLYTVLQPGDIIQGLSNGAGEVDITVSGYQFATP